MNHIKFSFLSVSILLTSALATAASGNWLSQLPDNVPVRELSLPGSHDAATGNGFASSSSFGALFAGVTQSLSLAEQWDAGVRVFDLRPTYKESADGKLQIYHGVLETKVSFKAALQTLVDKLADAPGEIAIVLMRHESDSDSGSDLWAGAVSSLLAEFDQYIATFSPDMTLRDARGKIIVLSRDNFSSSKAGMISGWSHSENFDDQKRASITLNYNRAELYAQDFYECQTTERKYNAVKVMLDYSTTNTKSAPWIINHTSGYIGSSGTNSNILNLAKVINGQVVEYLDGAEGRTGLVLMDFAGAATKSGTAVNGDKLVDKIIAQNSKYIKADVQNGVSTICDDETALDGPVYDLQGRCLGIAPDILKTLPAGLYICTRRKLIIK